MHTRDAPQFAIWMAALGELYGKTITAPISEMYWQALTHCDFKDVDRALQTHISSPDAGQFMPLPADIVRCISGTHEDRALAAWTNVTHAIRHVGAYESVAFDDPCIHLAIEAMGGWVSLCTTKTDALPFRAKEFQAHYRRGLNTRPTECHPILHGILGANTTTRVTIDHATHVGRQTAPNTQGALLPTPHGETTP